MRHAKWFIAGALAVPLLHQTALALMNAIGLASRAPFSMEPTAPFGVPQVLSLSFWGGVWGIVIGLLLDRMRTPVRFWMTAIVFGAIAPTLVAGLVVAPLKGLAVGGDTKLLLTGLVINAAWGVGTAAIFRLLSKRV